MKLPKRDQNHIFESESMQILQNSIPENWILRQPTERDYGIDCYIELTNRDNQLTGDLMSIQVKSTKHIVWTKRQSKTSSLNNIKIETTNYWNNFAIPVMLFVVDIEAREVFVIPVKEYIRQCYQSYIKQDKFSYTVRNDHKISRNPDDYMKLIVLYFMEKKRIYFETNMLRFFASIKRDRQFIEENIGRDFHLGIDIHKEVEMRALIVQIRDLCYYLDINWDLEPYEYYQLQSQNEFGNTYNIYEKYMTIILENLNMKIDYVFNQCRHLIMDVEDQYWVEKDNTLYNHLLYTINASGT